MNPEKKILLVEDEAITAMAKQQELKKYGYDVVAVATGEEAVAAIKPSSDIDLILMDINLGPGIDGTEAARSILSKHDIPIIFLSSHTEPDVVALTERITSYGYVVKQSGITVLDASIKMAFRLYEEKKRVQRHEEEMDASNEELQAAIEEMEATSETLQETNEELLISQQTLIDREKELVKSEHRFRSLFESLIEGVCLHKIIYDDNKKPIDYEILEVNPRYEEILSLNKEDVQHHKGSEIYGVSFPPYLELFARVADTGIHEKIETYFEPMKKHFHISVFSPEKGKFATVFEDITTRKESEEKLRESEEKYRTYIENAPEGIFIADANGKYIDVNEAACLMTGFSRDEILSMTIPQLLAPGAPIEDFFILKEKGKLVAETRLRNKTGDDFHIALSAIALSGNRYMAYCTDISDRKKAEESLLQKQSDLVRSQEIASVGTWQWPFPKGRIIWSDMMYTIYGLSPGSEPEPDMVRELILPEDRQHYDDAFSSINNTKIPDKISYRIKRSDGEIRNIVAYAQAVFSPEGTISGLFGTVQDVTDYTHSTEKIQQLLEEKELIMREVHHRIKNDMTTIRSLLSLQGSRSTSPEVKEVLKDAENRILLMGNIYNTLYRGEKIDTVNLAAFLRGLIDTINQSSSLKPGVKIKSDIAVLEVSSRDSFPVGIIINELLTNALKYAFPDQEKGEIIISVSEENKGKLEIAVTDTGIGIEDTVIEKKQYGFGLLLIETLVQQYKGTLKFASNGGTAVRLSLPLKKP